MKEVKVIVRKSGKMNCGSGFSSGDKCKSLAGISLDFNHHLCKVALLLKLNSC